VNSEPRLCRRLVALSVAVGLVGLHWVWMAARSQAFDAADDVVVTHYSLPALALIAIGGTLAWSGRAVWLLLCVQRAVSRLVEVPRPTKLTVAMRSADLEAVGCVDDPVPSAFCVGAVWPRVIVTTGLVERLEIKDLAAVLLHEREHLRRRDPLWRAAWRAASELLWHVPLIEWWSRRRLELSELAADRAAMRRLGPGPLARALTTATTPAGLDAAGFDGAAALRVAQILGDPLPARRPTGRALLVSAGALALTVNLAMCLVETAAHLVR
jgi:Zn-dependent protease with chaperone function